MHEVLLLLNSVLSSVTMLGFS